MMEASSAGASPTTRSSSITADHGEEFWDHGSVGHGHSVYEELLHVPMIVRWPGVTDGRALARRGRRARRRDADDARRARQPIPEEAARRTRSSLPLRRRAASRAARTRSPGSWTGGDDRGRAQEDRAATASSGSPSSTSRPTPARTHDLAAGAPDRRALPARAARAGARRRRRRRAARDAAPTNDLQAETTTIDAGDRGAAARARLRRIFAPLAAALP